MNRIDLTNLGGFPLEQDTLKFMQDGYEDVFAGIAAMLGDKVILSGVQAVGGNITNGWITYQGEIIKFVGAAAGAEVIIVETTQDALFEDGILQPVYKTRFATIGAPGNFLFSELKPANLGVPRASVIKYSGYASQVPVGYSLCDGALLLIADYPELYATIGTLHGGDGITDFAKPNLKGRFVVGYDGLDSDYDTVGKMGGQKEVTLNIAEMPRHGHKVRNGIGGSSTNPLDAPTSGFSGMDGNGGWLGSSTGSSNWIEQTGGDEAHENRPPYYTLAYIIKL